MNSIIGFAIESTVENLIPICLGLITFALIIWPLLSLVSLGKLSKDNFSLVAIWVIYSLIGAITGLVSYSLLNITNDHLTILEAIILLPTMFLISALLVAPALIIRYITNKMRNQK